MYLPTLLFSNWVPFAQFWHFFGVPLEYLCHLFGVPLSSLWRTLGFSFASFWRPFGLPSTIDIFWCSFGVHLAFIYYSLGSLRSSLSIQLTYSWHTLKNLLKNQQRFCDLQRLFSVPMVSFYIPLASFGIPQAFFLIPFGNYLESWASCHLLSHGLIKKSVVKCTLSIN